MGHEEIRLPPQNLTAEKAVLGAMLIDEEAIGAVLERRLDSAFFYSPAHQRIFTAVKRLYEERCKVDIITLSDRLKGDGALDMIGGAAYLAELIDTVPTAANVLHYADIVKDKGIRRKLIRNATDIVTKSFEDGAEVDELVDEAERLIFEIASDKQEQDATVVRDILKTTMEKIDMLHQRKASITGVGTGFYDLDRMTSGFQPSDLIIIAARPSMGKSALAGAIGENAAIKLGVGVAFFSLEMSKEQLVMRMLCSQAGVDAAKVRTGMLAASDWPLLTGASSKLARAKYFIDDTPAISPLELRAKTRRLKADKSNNIGLVVVDYLQLMRGSAKFENRQQEISEISRSLKGLARELQLPVIALSQLNRAVENRQDRKPQLSDLRESGAIEQDADVVILLTREEMYGTTPENQGIADIIIAKQRSGPTGDFKLRFRRECVRFENLDTVHTE